MVEEMPLLSLSRRRFLKRTGLAAAGLTVVAATSVPMARTYAPVLPSFGDPEDGDGLSWVQLLSNGKVRFFCPRQEMGQGASLGLSQVVAEELNLDQAQIECVMPSTNQIEQVKMTVGSESIFAFLQPVALSAATLREELRKRAARRSGENAHSVKDASGGFKLPDGSRISYSDLADTKSTFLTVATEEEPELYSLSQNRETTVIGKSWRHHQLEAIVTGSMTYGRDVQMQGLLFGAVVRPPAFGAKIQKVAPDKAEELPFVVKVVTDLSANFAGVVTDTPFKLKEAVEALEVEWSAPDVPTQADLDRLYDVDAHRKADDFNHLVFEEGDVASGRSTAKTRVSARYDTSFLAHSPMEPRGAIVWVKEERAEVWCGTQDAYFVRGRVAKITGLDPENVIVHPQRMGGGFGGRIQCQPSEEAARLSQAVGAPVRVEWDRETELSGNYFQPVFSHHIETGANAEGKLSHWQHDYVTSPIMFGPMRELLGQSSLTETAIGVMDRFVADMGSKRGAIARYRAANRRIRYASVRSVLPTSAWRGLGSAPNAFAIECAMDELAQAANIDPLALRLRNLTGKDERLKAVLEKAAKLSEWPNDPGKNRGLGIASAVYKDQTPVAIVAKVHVDDETADIRVEHIWCAHDCGLIVNPDQVLNLIEGNIIWGCGLALKERITVEEGTILEQNFHLYEPLRFSEAPEITISLIEPPGTPPVGVGESALPPVAPAIANAVFAATGKRLRRLPMSFDDLDRAS